MELAGFILFAVAVLSAALYFSNKQAAGHWEPVDGVVVRRGMYSDYDGNGPMLIVRLANGREQQVHVSPQQFSSCTVGDPIALMQQGMAYRVALEGCLARN